MAKPSGNRTHDDGVVYTRNVLNLLGCPDVEFGEGTDLFPQDLHGKSGPTPDLVAGPFHGPTNPYTFFVDVVSPSGAYMFDAKAGAGNTAQYLGAQVAGRRTFSFDSIPLDFARPIVTALRRKANKYTAARSNSPLFALTAYFDDAIRSGGPLFASLAFFRALDAELGLPGHEQIEQELIGTSGDRLVAAEVNWDVPLAFMFYLRRAAVNELRMALLVNTHARLDGFRDHPVVAWTKGVLDEVGAR